MRNTRGRALAALGALGKWAAVALAAGGATGLAGTAFHLCVGAAETARGQWPFLYNCLPLAGLLLWGAYRLCRVPLTVGTNRVLEAVRSPEGVPPMLAPAIFAGTFLTHLCGGSAGREGAALQLGGSLGTLLGRAFRLDEKDRHIAVLCGMSGLFAALFGTPATATVFVLEVVSVGEMYYAALLPCAVSALTAALIAGACGIAPTAFALAASPALAPLPLLSALALGGAMALCSIAFCALLGRAESLAERLVRNPLLRIASGGAAVALLTLLLGTRDYNGAGMAVVARAVAGEARPEAFALKMLLTALTIASGFKGGEIVPTFFVGSTLGCVLGPLLGLDAGFGAALGLCAMFCGMVNCPLAAVLLSVELFGAAGLPYFLVACAAGYMLSGNYSLYKSQKIVYSKLRAEFVDRFAHS